MQSDISLNGLCSSNNMGKNIFTDHQSIYIGVPVSRGYRRKRRRRRSSREAPGSDRERRYSHHGHHDRYRDIDVEEGLMDSAEQSLQDINRTGKCETRELVTQKKTK